MLTKNDLPKIKSHHIHTISVLLIRGILWFPALLIVHFLLRMEVRGKENLKKLPSGRVIFAANHSSELDPYAFQYSLSLFSKFVPLYFVSLTKTHYPFTKFGFRSFLYGGMFFRLMGAYPVYKGLQNFEKAFLHHIRILERNHSVLMFPVGKMHDGVAGEAKSGIVFLAKRTQAYVVPVKIQISQKISARSLLLRKCRLCITFGEPQASDLYTGQQTSLTIDEQQKWANYIMQKVEEL